LPRLPLCRGSICQPNERELVQVQVLVRVRLVKEARWTEDSEYRRVADGVILPRILARMSHRTCCPTLKRRGAGAYAFPPKLFLRPDDTEAKGGEEFFLLRRAGSSCPPTRRGAFFVRLALGRQQHKEQIFFRVRRRNFEPNHPCTTFLTIVGGCVIASCFSPFYVCPSHDPTIQPNVHEGSAGREPDSLMNQRQRERRDRA
jgi:hypothetical protein